MEDAHNKERCRLLYRSRTAFERKLLADRGANDAAGGTQRERAFSFTIAKLTHPRRKGVTTRTSRLRINCRSTSRLPLVTCDTFDTRQWKNDNELPSLARRPM